MKNRLKTLSEWLLSLAIVSMPLNAYAESDDPETLADLTWIQMLHSVDTGKVTELIQEFQENEARKVLLRGIYNKKNNNKCRVENMRNKEVLLVTIPASLLFAPNATELSTDAPKYLEPIKRYLKQPDMWRVMLVMHTDNTGSPRYREEITEKRVLAVTDWFEDQPNLDTSYLFPYALSDFSPLANTPNISMDNRDANRRLEIYLVPGERMVEMAKKGKMAF